LPAKDGARMVPHHARPFFRFAERPVMSMGKIIPLIAEAERSAKAEAEAELRELIDATDAQIDELERQLDEKLKQIIDRIEKLEGG